MTAYVIIMQYKHYLGESCWQSPENCSKRN